MIADHVLNWISQREIEYVCGMIAQDPPGPLEKLELCRPLKYVTVAFSLSESRYAVTSFAPALLLTETVPLEA